MFLKIFIASTTFSPFDLNAIGEEGKCVRLSLGKLDAKDLILTLEHRN